MSITPSADNAPDPAPLMTVEQQQEALTLLAAFYDEDAPPFEQTKVLLDEFEPSTTWRRA